MTTTPERRAIDLCKEAARAASRAHAQLDEAAELANVAADAIQSTRHTVNTDPAADARQAARWVADSLCQTTEVTHWIAQAAAESAIAAITALQED